MPEAAAPLAYAMGFVLATVFCTWQGLPSACWPHGQRGASRCGPPVRPSHSAGLVPDRGAMKRPIFALAVAGFPVPAAAHDAFGDLGPFYAAMLHPVVDPVQGLLLVAVALLLARQPLAIVRPAYAALAGSGCVILLVSSLVTFPSPAPQVLLLAAVLAAVTVLVLPRPAPTAAILFAAALGGLAALSFDPVTGSRTVLLTTLGGAVSVALLPLLVWGAGEWADRRVSPYATSVLASWVAAIALMTAVVPT